MTPRSFNSEQTGQRRSIVKAKTKSDSSRTNEQATISLYKSCIWQTYSLSLRGYNPRREDRDVWCSTPVWNPRAVSSLLSQLSFFCLVHFLFLSRDFSVYGPFS